MSKKALITGITGQDGSYLAELLLSKGYEVHGLIRRASTFNTGRLDPIYDDPHSGKSRMFLHYGDLSDASALARLIGKIQPEEVYNLAAQSHVRVSFDSPEYTTDITATGTVRLLEAIRETGIRPRQPIFILTFMCFFFCPLLPCSIILKRLFGKFIFQFIR